MLKKKFYFSHRKIAKKVKISGQGNYLNNCINMLKNILLSSIYNQKLWR